MSLDRLALNLKAHPATPSFEKSDRLRIGSGPHNALAFVRRTPETWHHFRILERSVLEGALALTLEGRGQVLFVTLHGPRAFTDRRIDSLEVKAIDPNRPFALMFDLLRAALARADARPAASSLPASLTAALKKQSVAPDADRETWFDAVTHFFTQLAARKPLMIVLGGMHRADADSLAFVHRLARAVPEKRLLLLVAYNFDSPPHPPLAQMMTSLLEARLARSLVIAAPYVDEVRLLFQYAFGRSARMEAAAASLAEDDEALLVHGLTAIEACRRAGRWPDAKSAAERLAASAESHHSPFLLHSANIVLGHILADHGKWDESLERLEQIQSQIESAKDDTLIAWLYWGLARSRWGKADRRRAFQMLRLAQTVAARSGDDALHTSIALCGVEWLADHRRVRVSRDWLALVEQAAGRSSSLPITAAHAQANGIIALAEGDAVSATGYFRSALRQWTVYGSHYDAARSSLRLASALLRRDDSESRREGREALVDAHSAFTRLGAAWDVTSTEELGAQYGVRPRARRAASNGSASPGGITPREREVLELLVRGMTNRQIAATLSITEKTAEGHVSNILAKLGVASRGQAAGYAVANGLLEAVEA